MTWCAKIYEMFNGWTDEEHLAAIEAPPSRPIRKELAVLFPDSPFLERSTSLDDPPLFNPS